MTPLGDMISGWARPLFGRSVKQPVIAVIDSPSPHSTDKVDIDGDGIGDIAHGQVSALYVKRKKPNARLLMMDSEAPIPTTATTNEATRLGCEGRIHALQQVRDKLQNGEAIQAVNFSVNTAGTSFEELGNVIGMDLSPGVLEAARHQNFEVLRGTIRRRLFALADRADKEPMNETQYRYAYYGKVIQAMESVTRHGVPIYVAAGNGGPSHLNIYSLAQGTRNIAAVNARGEKTSYTSDSTDNPLIDGFVRGDYNVKAITRQGQTLGYNITGGNTVEIAASQVSGQGRYVNPALQRFNNARLADVALRPMELSLLQTNGLNAHSIRVVPQLQKRLLRVEDFGRLKGYGEEMIQKLKSQGEYTTWDGQWTFRLRPDGTLTYNPDGSPQDSPALVVNINRGTSFSAPSAIV